MLGMAVQAAIDDNQKAKFATIVQAENGVIVATAHQEEIDASQMMAQAGHIEGETWKGTPKFQTRVMKTHVFTDLGKAMKFIQDYLEEKE